MDLSAAVAAALPRGVAVRPATAEDEPHLQALHASTMAPVLVDAGLAPMQHEARQRGLRDGWPASIDHVVSVDGTAAGRLWLVEEDGALRVLDVALLPGHRGRGTGGALIDAVAHAAAARGGAVRLSVAHDDVVARGLYERRGFVEVAADPVRAELERPPVTG